MLRFVYVEKNVSVGVAGANFDLKFAPVYLHSTCLMVLYRITLQLMVYVPFVVGLMFLVYVFCVAFFSSSVVGTKQLE